MRLCRQVYPAAQPLSRLRICKALARLAPPGLLALLVLLDLPEPRARAAMLVLLACPAPRARQGQRAILARPDPPEILGLRAPQATLGPLGLQAILVLLAPRVI